MVLHKKNIPFQKELFLSISGFFILFVAITMSLQYYQEKNIRYNNLYRLMQEYNYHVANLLDKHQGNDLPNNNSLTANSFSNYPYRLTIIDIDTGKVLLDNGTSQAISQSHIDRPEIKSAINSKKNSYSIRYSETLKDTYFYVAYRHENYVIRTSIPYDETVSDILHVDPLFRYILIIIAGMFVVVLFVYCHLLGRSILNLEELAEKAKLNLPLDNTIYDDTSTLGRITQNLRENYDEIRKAREELTLQEEKLLAHIQLSREGIAIFTHDRKMIVSNNLFIQYTNHITDRTLDDNLEEVFTEPALQEIIEYVTAPDNTIENSNPTEIKQIDISKNGLHFIVRGIRFHDHSFEISIFDNTEREREDLVQKQLTQNIAHELKTPVSSIRGYLETILDTPGISADKQQQFLERSYAQSRRLSDLLNDISILNRLDETSEVYDSQNTDLYSIIKEAISDSATSLDNKSMRINTLGIQPDMPLKGNISLLYSIFRNLIDNSIAYAGYNTEITINCYHTDNQHYYISFADNGVGVEEAHLNRLFERFYRVDKGRSRKLGGTGLGLAIVKNAVLFHGGEIMAKNAQGGGLDILFTLRKN
ncbi:MAG: ATP-binding protein [Bacteroidaceae bacterium]|nr:ATP-binding protein [Bacteroidaceae bacterium]